MLKLFFYKNIEIIASISTIIIIFGGLYVFFKFYFLPRFKMALQNTFEDLLEQQDNNLIKSPSNPPEERKRDKEKEKEKEMEIIFDHETEMEILSKQQTAKPQNPKVVGMNLKVFGKFTKKLLGNLINSMQGVNPATINEKGFYQARELARKGEISRSSPGARNL